MIVRRPKTEPLKATESLSLRQDGTTRLAIVADTHSNPHPRLMELVASMVPDGILHAGDIGGQRVLDDLARIAKVVAVRGNIDVRLPGVPDELMLDLVSSEGVRGRILLLHVGVHGPFLRSEVKRKAKAESATMVVCGHSHVPFIGKDRGTLVFNPGSAGPRRFGLPIVFGKLEIDAAGFRLQHIDCESGLVWEPPHASPPR